MKMQAAKVNGLHGHGLCSDVLHHAMVNAKLVLRKSGGDTGKGMGADVRIHPQAYLGHYAFPGSQLGNDLQFCQRLHIKAANTCLQAQEYLPIGLPHSGINNFPGSETGIQGGLYFPAAHAVCPKTETGNLLQQNRIVIGLHGIMNHPLRLVAQLRLNGIQGLLQKSGVVVVKRRLKGLEALYGVRSF